MHPAFLYLPGRRLSISELSAARIDGDVVELGELYVPADLVEGATLRAHAVLPMMPPGTAAAGPTAAWIHGAGDAPPTRHHVQRTTPHRPRVARHRRLVYHDRCLAAEDVVILSGVAVTTPERTLCDMLLASGRDPGLEPWIRGLAVIAPSTVEYAGLALNTRRRVPGLHAALRALDALRDAGPVRTT
ncbi:hypothetical protein [Microbacterium sp.]|uniref:hypothetical protein n=1 Tax=Microbacterium sp. TaxID=51671 RepID=UPI0039E54F6B